MVLEDTLGIKLFIKTDHETCHTIHDNESSFTLVQDVNELSLRWKYTCRKQSCESKKQGTRQENEEGKRSVNRLQMDTFIWLRLLYNWYPTASVMLSTLMWYIQWELAWGFQRIARHAGASLGWIRVHRYQISLAPAHPGFEVNMYGGREPRLVISSSLTFLKFSSI